ncbi:FAD-binding oxidoreductase, partial [Streptosporangium minutum]
MGTKTLDGLVRRLLESFDHGAVITDPVRLRTYECDGLTHHRATPGVVVLPETAEQIAAVVRACNEYGVPFVARGAGTG